MAPPRITPKDEQEPSFIGVPDDYRTDYRGSNIISGAVQMRPDLYPVQVGPSYETDGPNTASAMAAVASLSPENTARLQIKLAKAGLISKSSVVQVGVFDDVTESAYREVLGIANRYGMSDTDALAMLESQPSLAAEDLAGAKFGKDGSLKGLGRDEGPKYETKGSRTDTTTQKFTRLDAESAADAAFQEALGEDASPKQIAALRKALNAYAKANPTVSTTDSTYDEDTGRELSSSTTTSGGITAAGAQTIAQNMARSAPQYAEVQAATTYWNALEQALDSTADV